MNKKYLTSWKCTILFLLSGFWLLTTINGSYRDFSFIDRILIFSLSALICGFQVAFLLTVTRIKFLPRDYNIFFAIFSVVNLFCLYLFFIVSFAVLSPLVQFFVFLIALVIAYQFFCSLSDDGWWGKIIIAVAGALFLFNIVFFIHQSYPDTQKMALNLDRDKTASLQAKDDIGENKTLFPNIKIVNFNEKPNIYFLSFDALSPAPLMRKHLPMSGNFAPLAFVTKNNFRVFKNAFSDYPRTRETLNHVLAMTPDYFQTLIKQKRNLDLFTGLSPAPAFEIFKANGYTTNTYFHDGYMGHEAGSYVDNYNIANLRHFAFCKNQLAEFSVFGFWGYCQFWESEWVKNIVFHLSWEVSFVKERTLFEYADFVLEDFSRLLAAEKPFVAFIHILSPFHSKQPITPEDYRELLLVALAEETPNLMAKFFDYIQENDPDAYIYFYGDHGQLLSWSVPDKLFHRLNKKGRDYVIQDRYGIQAAFYPADVCAEYFEAPMMRPFVTNAKVLRQVIRCLADGDDPIIAPIEYRLHQTHRGYQGDEPGYFEDYLYE